MARILGYQAVNSAHGMAESRGPHSSITDCDLQSDCMAWVLEGKFSKQKPLDSFPVVDSHVRPSLELRDRGTKGKMEDTQWKSRVADRRPK